MIELTAIDVVALAPPIRIARPLDLTDDGFAGTKLVYVWRPLDREK